MAKADEELVRECLNGSREAFDELIERYYGMIYDYVYARIRDYHWAEDVTQEAFLQAYVAWLNVVSHLNLQAGFIQ
jgi:RNA polymerase sigma-70 factor (ECF subfamily)